MGQRPLLGGTGGLLTAAPTGFPGVDLGHAGQQALPIILIHVVAIACLVVMYLHFRGHDDADFDDGGDSGGGNEPRPGPAGGPADYFREPPLGEIRAHRTSERDPVSAPDALSG